MSLPQAKKRAAPKVSAENADRATANIRAKLACLSLQLSRNTQGKDRLPAGLPTSVRQFNAWSGAFEIEGECRGPVSLAQNSPKTLRRYEALSGEASKLVAVVSRRYRAEVAPAKEESKARLRNEVRNGRELAAIANRALIRAKIQIEDLQETVNRLNSSLASVAATHKQELEKLEERIRKMAAENVVLRAKRASQAKLKVV